MRVWAMVRFTVAERKAVMRAALTDPKLAELAYKMTQAHDDSVRNRRAMYQAERRLAAKFKEKA